MIVKSWTRREVGRRYTDVPVSDNSQTPHRVPFVVLRTATLEEWIADARTELPPPSAHAIRHAQQPGMHFYQISVD